MAAKAKVTTILTFSLSPFDRARVLPRARRGSVTCIYDDRMSVVGAPAFIVLMILFTYRCIDTASVDDLAAFLVPRNRDSFPIISREIFFRHFSAQFKGTEFTNRDVLAYGMVWAMGMYYAWNRRRVGVGVEIRASYIGIYIHFTLLRYSLCYLRHAQQVYGIEEDTITRINSS